MKYIVEYDDLTEEFDIKIDKGTWLSVSGYNRGEWAKKICKLLNSKPLNKGKCNGSLNPEHEPDCELMQTGAPVCTCDAENRLHIPTHINGSIGCGDACKQCGGNSLSCGCC